MTFSAYQGVTKASVQKDEPAAALDCPVAVHPLPFADMPWNVVTRMGLQDDAEGHLDKGLALRQGLGNALDVMIAMGWFVAGGICVRGTLVATPTRNAALPALGRYGALR